VCFVGIFQERVSPVSVVGWGSFATFLGWLLWDYWVTQETQGGTADAAARGRMMRGERTYEEYRRPHRHNSSLGQPMLNTSTASISSTSNFPSAASSTSNLLQDYHHNLRRQSSQPPSNANNNSSNRNSLLIPGHPYSRSASSINSATSQPGVSAHSQTSSAATAGRLNADIYQPEKPPSRRTPTSSPARGSSSDGRSTPAGGRAYVRVSTVKSAILIYFTLLGLSPILKSLTRSTSSDSIWAMSFWLLAINIFFFDYSGGPQRPPPAAAPAAAAGSSPQHHNRTLKRMPVASLSTNAALMASTVLASRLPSTGQVFSLTLFSIEVFGLFPVFRQYARHRSWRYHVILTVLLVLGAGGGVGMVLGDAEGAGKEGGCWSCWPWKRGLLGMVVGCLISAVAMGGCSWWLIGLQKYKNEIYGPWDPARPIIISRRHWDDE
jgi:phosphatidylinositol glycan class C protein